jgi:GDP-L-fucose synthase
MKILVTGSNGLVGQALKKVLGPGHVYHTRQDVDLSDYKSTYEYLSDKVKNENVDTIIHAAALVGGVKANSENNQKFFYENYVINSNVLKSAFELKVPNLVNILSTCIFPDKNIEYPLSPNQIDNGEPHDSNYGYSYAKRLSGYETKIFRNVSKSNWFSVVPTNLYGPHDNFNLNDSHLIPGMIHRAYLAKQNNEKFVIWGDGTPLRQFLFSEDLANLIVRGLQNWNSEEHCMLVNEQEISVLEVANIIKKYFDFDETDIIFDETKPKGQFRKPAISNVSNFNFKSIEDGLKETIDWFIKNYNSCRK